MKAAVVTHDHQVNVTDKKLRPLQHGEHCFPWNAVGSVTPICT